MGCVRWNINKRVWWSIHIFTALDSCHTFSTAAVSTEDRQQLAKWLRGFHGRRTREKYYDIIIFVLEIIRQNKFRYISYRFPLLWVLLLYCLIRFTCIYIERFIFDNESNMLHLPLSKVEMIILPNYMILMILTVSVNVMEKKIEQQWALKQNQKW